MAVHIERVEIPVTGTRLAGDMHVPEEKTGVVVISYHGFTKDRRYMSRLAGRCARRGAVVFNMDMRGHGESGGEYDIGMCAFDLVEIAGSIKEDTNAELTVTTGYSAGGAASPLASICDAEYPDNLIDLNSAIQPPNWLRYYEWRNYTYAVMVNPLTEWLIDRYEDRIMPVIRKINPGIDRLHGQYKYTVGNAHTNNLTRFKKGAVDCMRLTSAVSAMNGNPYFIAVSPNDTHVDYRDGLKLAKKLRKDGRDVTAIVLEDNFRVPEGLVPVADKLMDWTASRAIRLARKSGSESRREKLYEVAARIYEKAVQVSEEEGEHEKAENYRAYAQALAERKAA